MIISHQRKYIYLVVPKCASSTLRHSLAPFTDIGYPKTAYEEPSEQHMTLPTFQQSKYAPLLNEYFTFTFVRNPYDRLYSGFLQDRLAWRSWPIWTIAKMEIFEQVGDDFNQYVLDYVSRADIRTDWRWVSFCPMTEYAFDAGGNFRLDWFGRAENFNEDLQTLAGHIDATIEKVPDRNVKTPVQQGLKYIDKYAPETLKFVNETYGKDFEVFGYETVKP